MYASNRGLLLLCCLLGPSYFAAMHKAWPRLLKRMNANKADAVDDRNLVIASRTWFCLYLFEHQSVIIYFSHHSQPNSSSSCHHRLSYGTGRPAVLKDDESIRDCRYLLNHPLAIEDDMRLVSTVELIAIRERVHNAMAPFEGPVKPEHFDELQRADVDFKNWYESWDEAFSRKYEHAGKLPETLHKYSCSLPGQLFIARACKSSNFMLNYSTMQQL